MRLLQKLSLILVLGTCAAFTTTADKVDSKPSIQEVFKTILDDKYLSITNEEKEKIQKQGYADTYGEMTEEGIRQMIAHAYTTFPELEQTHPKRFVDIGSGRGAVTLGVALLTNVESADGIEISPTRYSFSIEALKKINETWPALHLQDRVNFKNNDAMKEDLKGYNFIWISSLCFPPDVIEKLTAKLDKELPKGAVIYSTKSFSKDAMKRLKFVEVINLPMTWSKESSTNVYKVAS